MKLIMESRIFSCVVSSGLGVGVGLPEPVGVGVVIGVGVGAVGNGEVGTGDAVGSGEGVGVAGVFWERSCVMAQQLITTAAEAKITIRIATAILAIPGLDDKKRNFNRSFAIYDSFSFYASSV